MLKKGKTMTPYLILKQAQKNKKKKIYLEINYLGSYQLQKIENNLKKILKLCADTDTKKYIIIMIYNKKLYNSKLYSIKIISKFNVKQILKNSYHVPVKYRLIR